MSPDAIVQKFIDQQSARIAELKAIATELADSLRPFVQQTGIPYNAEEGKAIQQASSVLGKGGDMNV